MPDSDTPHATIGDNISVMEEYRDLNRRLPDYLAAEHASMVRLSKELEDEFRSFSGPVETDDRERSLTDLGARISKFVKDVDLQRKIDKRTPTEGSDAVESFFRSVGGAVAVHLETIRKSINTYKDAKAAEERRRRDEERKAAMAAQQEADRQAREAERLRREAEDARRAEEDQAATDGRSPKPTPEELAAQEAQRQAEARAVEARRAAEAVPKPAVATMVTAESGAKSGQILRWTADIEDLDVLDLEALRPFISRGELEKAARGYALRHTDTKPLRGARIYQKSTTTFRS